ncbi:hypothetical protein [Paenibacillus sp. PL2-23]|uniref:hypothetical protein n=1 Tax=Paenibacillus sp. PL2-23 TaxID=2100729 RepID=UPI0030FC71EF
MFRLFKKKEVSFESQLSKLAECGIRLKHGIDPTLLLEQHSEQEFVEDPYQLLLITMGGEVYINNQFYHVSDDVWHLDTECIEDHGDYIRIIERLKNLTGIDIEDLTDYVDIEANEAWVSFIYEGTKIRWDLNVDADWLDPIIMYHFQELIKNRKERRITVASLGQDCLITYLKESQLKDINKLVKIKFE